MATSFIYTYAPVHALSATLNYASGTIKCALLDNTYTPNQDTHVFVSDLSGELTDGSYSRKTLTGTSLSTDVDTNTTSLLADSPVFTGLAVAFQYVVFFLSTGTDSTSGLIALVDYTTDQNTSPPMDVTVTISPTTGIAQSVVA